MVIEADIAPLVPGAAPGSTAGCAAPVPAGTAGASPAGGQEIERALAATPAPASRLSAPGACRALGVSLPPGARYRGYRYEAEDLRSAGDCLAGQDCPIGEARFLDHPRRVPRPGLGDILIATFANRSATERTARARFTVYFEPATAPAGPR